MSPAGVRFERGEVDFGGERGLLCHLQHLCEPFVCVGCGL